MSNAPTAKAPAITDATIVTTRSRRRQFLKAIGTVSALSSISLATAACGESSDECRNVTDADPFDTTRLVCDGD
jgi:hypothetical protein